MPSPSTTASALLAATLLTASPTSAYPVDCAILLCLSGGWPASAECTHARAVFIHRITPFPIEPPLQIWRCPMSIAAPQMQSRPDAHLIPIIGAPADIDITGPEFDFVRSIRVIHGNAVERDEETGCYSRDYSEIGTYDGTGQFNWTPFDIGHAPPQMRALEDKLEGCGVDWRLKRVYVEWQDSSGNRSFEIVDY